MTKKPRDLASLLKPLDEPVLQTSEPVEVTRSEGQGLKPVGLLVTPDDKRRLLQLSLDTGLSLQKLGLEAWNLLLEKRGLAPLETVTANVPSGRRR